MKADEARQTALMYRQRAEEIRAIAEADRQLETYQALIKIAANYEGMAHSLEEIVGSKDEPGSARGAD